MKMRSSSVINIIPSGGDNLNWDAAKGMGGGLKVERRLTAKEVVSQCRLFLLAGYDTTSNALAYAAYLLATHPDYQERLRDGLYYGVAKPFDASFVKILHTLSSVCWLKNIHIPRIQKVWKLNV